MTELPIPDERVYHGPLGDIVKKLEPHTEADPIGILASLLTYVSAAIGPASYFDAGRPGRRPLTVWTLLIGDTGSAKGTSLAAAREIFSRADPSFMEQSYFEGFPASGPALIELIDEMAKSAGHETAFGFPVMFAKDEWSEVMSARLGDPLCIAWEGKTLRNMTRSNGLLSVPRPHMAIAGHVTPGKFIAKISAKADDVAQGVYNRFLFFVVDKSKSLPFGGDLSDGDYDAMADIVRRGVEYGRQCGRITWGEDSRELWVQLYDELPNIATESEIMQQFSARTLEYALRISAIFAIMDGRDRISFDDLKAAEMIIKYSVDCVRYVLDTEVPRTRKEEIVPVTSDRLADPRLSEKVLSYIHKKGEVTSSEILRKFNAKRDDIEAVIAANQDKVIKVALPSRGGPRTKVYRYVGSGEPDDLSEAPRDNAPRKVPIKRSKASVDRTNNLFGW